MDAFKLVLVTVAGWVNRQQQHVIDYLQEEIRILKEQQGSARPRFTDEQRSRLARKAKRIRFGRLREIANLVTPQTLLKWHRQLVARKYDGSGKRRNVGRPPTAEEIRQIVIRIAEENRGWGYTRIRGALANLGHEIGRGTVADILKGAGLEPAPERGRKTTWAEFLKMHWEVLGATDFFTVEVWTPRGLVRYHVLFVIRLSTRKVHVAGIVPEPDGEWMEQVGRNLTDCVDGFLSGCRYLIHDRSALFTKGFLSNLESAGVKSVRLPARSPNLNAFVESFNGTFRDECLNENWFTGLADARRITEAWRLDYNEVRPHSSLDDRTPGEFGGRLAAALRPSATLQTSAPPPGGAPHADQPKPDKQPIPDRGYSH